MFDLFRSRQKAMRYLLGAILTVVAVSMVITLIPGYGTSNGTSANDTVIAEIGSDKLTTQDVMTQINNVLRGQQLPAAMLQTYIPQMVDRMIQQRALNYEFSREGLTVTDGELIDVLQAEYGQFFQNGVFMKDQLAAALAQEGQTLQDAIDMARGQVMYNKISNLDFEATVVSPKEIDAELERKYEHAKIEYIAFTPAKFRDQVKITPEDIKAYYDAHKMQYQNPEKRSFQVVVIDQDKVEKGMTVTDAQLHAAYSASMDNFRTPERVHVRHIMFKTTDKSDAEKKQILAKAQDALKQLRAGADFAELAKKDSDDTANAQKGGDLDWVVKGQTVPEFEHAAFSLKDNQISDIITTPYSYDIIQVLAHEPARVKPFDEVKAAITDDLKKQNLTDKMQETADKVHQALVKAPGSADAIAKQYGLDVVTVTKAASGEAIPTLGVSPEVDGAVAQMKKNDVSDVLTLPADRLAVVVLNDKFPPAVADMKDVEGKIRDALIDQKSQLMAQDKAKEAAGKIQGGEDMDKVAKAMKLEVTQSTNFGHADSVEGLGSATYLDDAFKKPVGTVVGPTNIMGRWVVYKIEDQQRVDVSKLPAERAAIAHSLRERKGAQVMALFMDSVVTRLAEEGKVKKHEDVLKRLIAQYRQQ
jgi:peptidyl-prolyl cis-trans isomerase D